MNTKRVVVATLISVGVLALMLQLVPYGGATPHRPVVQEPAWDSPQTRELARRACFDCHSNQTVWPWYASVAPMSWLVRDHVDEGREHLNFSEWQREQEDAHEAAEEVGEGEMPPWEYTLLHPRARLTEAERRALIHGLELTLGEDK